MFLYTGYMLYFFIMSGFLWLNVLCFDLWNNSAGHFKTIHIIVELRRFSAYNLYAWGLAALFTIITGLVQLSGVPDNVNPKIGRHYCWFDCKYL